MTLLDIRAQLEEEQTWRRDEIRFLRNQLANMQSDTERDNYRRSLIVMLYAHFEGFCKAALLQYVKVVNDANLKCGEAVSAIVAASWYNIFKELENADAKSPIFRAQLPNDTQLYRFARRRHFIEQIEEFHQLPAEIPDAAVNVEDNLTPIVMKKVLYRIGINHDAFAQHDDDILLLVNRRNHIAHGVRRKGVGEAAYNKVESAVFKIMEDLMDLIIESIKSEVFKRPATGGKI